MGIIAALVIGAIAGWLAGLIVRGAGFGLLGNIVIGIVGALVAGFAVAAASCRACHRHARRDPGRYRRRCYYSRHPIVGQTRLTHAPFFLNKAVLAEISC
jgi:hypothetical protein